MAASRSIPCICSLVFVSVITGAYSQPPYQQNSQALYPFLHRPPPPTVPPPPPTVPPPPPTVIVAVAVTSASTLVLSGALFLLFLRFCRFERQRVASLPSDEEGKRVLPLNDVFVRKNWDLKGVIVDENGVNMVYWRILENGGSGLSFKKQIYRSSEEDQRTTATSPESTQSNQEHPLLRSMSSTSEAKVFPETETSENVSRHTPPTPIKRPVPLPFPFSSQSSLAAAAPPPPPPPIKRPSAPPFPSLLDSSLAVAAPPPPPPLIKRPSAPPFPSLLDSSLAAAAPPPPPPLIKRPSAPPFPSLLNSSLAAAAPPPPPTPIRRPSAPPFPSLLDSSLAAAAPPPPPPPIKHPSAPPFSSLSRSSLAAVAPPPPPPRIKLPAPTPSPSSLHSSLIAAAPPPPPLPVKRPAPPPPRPTQSSLAAGAPPLPLPPSRRPVPPMAPQPKVNASASSSSPGESTPTNRPGEIKLKPLHWEKVNPNPDHSMVWDNVVKGSFSFDGDLMELLFGYTATNTMSNDLTSTPRQGKTEPSQIFILDPRKSQNTAIVLKSLGATCDEIMDSLIEGQGLHADIIEKLAKIAPTQEETSKLLAFDGDPTKLADAESFLYQLLKAVPSAFIRSKAMLFRASYDAEVSHVRESLQSLESACKELRTRGLFLKLLEAVLKTGNRLNAGTWRGNAEAFNLNALKKLSDVKSSDGKTTLLQFVVQEVVRTEGKRCLINRTQSLQKEDAEREYMIHGLPIVGGLSSEFSSVKKAATLDRDSLLKTISSLETQISEFRKRVEKCGTQGGFANRMKRFLETAGLEMQAVKEEQTRVMELVKKTTNYYHAGSQRHDETNPFQLFVIIRDFLVMVDRVCIDITRSVQRRRTVAHFLPEDGRRGS